MFILQENPITLSQTKNTLPNSTNGAFVSFEGIVRNDKNQNNEACLPDRQVSSLLYIADSLECIAEGEKILNEALKLFPLNNAICIQRIGQVSVGEAATWIGVWASHRDEAFKGCRYIIEEIKKRLLIWKKESFSDGTKTWVQPK